MKDTLPVVAVVGLDHFFIVPPKTVISSYLGKSVSIEEEGQYKVIDMDHAGNGVKMVREYLKYYFVYDIK
jgi:hypothetical protein